MLRILADASLPNIERILSPLTVNLYYDTASLSAQRNENDILLCRSTLVVNKALLHDSRIKIIGTASSGSDHIDKPYLQSQGIKWFSAKGVNAHAVADYICMIIAYLLQQKNTALGKNAGIVGYGAVGKAVKQRLTLLGFNVKCCDPWQKQQPSFQHYPLEALKDCDLLLLHCNYHRVEPYPSHHLIDKNFLRNFNPNGLIINAARGNIVDEEALLDSPQCQNYCTDVFHNEPNINPALIDQCLCATPHIAGHSIEAKYNAVISVLRKIYEYTHTRPTALVELKSPQLDVISLHNAQWINRLLSMYNPQNDSEKLKNSMKLAETFIQLRKAHNKRHEVCWNLDQQ